MPSENVVISAYVPIAVAAAIERQAQAEDRSKSKVAGRILAMQVRTAREPSVQFATGKRRKSETK